MRSERFRVNNQLWFKFRIQIRKFTSWFLFTLTFTINVSHNFLGAYSTTMIHWHCQGQGKHPASVSNAGYSSSSLVCQLQYWAFEKWCTVCLLLLVLWAVTVWVFEKYCMSNNFTETHWTSMHQVNERKNFLEMYGRVHTQGSENLGTTNTRALEFGKCSVLLELLPARKHWGSVFRFASKKTWKLNL